MCVSNLEATEVHGFENYDKRHILSVPSWRLRLFGLFLFIMAKSINLALYTFFSPLPLHCFSGPPYLGTSLKDFIWTLLA